MEGRDREIQYCVSGVKEEYKTFMKSLKGELVEKDSLVEQPKAAGSELQLELDKLCTQNLLRAWEMKSPVQ